MRKGQLTVPLTWVFGLLAGVAILSLILIFINAQKEESEISTSLTVLEHIDTELRAISKTQNTFNKLEIPEIKLISVCDNKETSAFWLEGATQTIETKNQAIFTQQELEGETLLAWTQDWALPTNVDRFLYVSNQEVIFILIQDPQGHLYWRDFLDKLPDDYPSNIVNSANEHDIGGHDRYVFVFFDTPDFMISQIQQSQLQVSGNVYAIALYPTTAGDLFSNGNVTFFEMKNNFVQTGKSFYMSPALLFGAVFSEDQNFYECNLNKALFKLKIQAEINRDRATDVLNNLPPSGECYQIMQQLPFHYQMIIDNAVLDLNKLGILFSNAIEVSNIGFDLGKGENCPTL